MLVSFTYTKVRLTQHLIERAQPAVINGEPRPVIYADTDSPLALRVSAQGAKSFLVLGRVAGRKIRDTFDIGARLPLKDARGQARKRLGKMVDGENPIEVRRQERVEARKAKARGITLRDAMKLREETLRAKGRSDRTVEGDRYVIEKYLPGWLDLPLAEISREDARRRHRTLTKSIAEGKYAKDAWRKRGEGFGLATANRTMRAFRAVYNRALKQHPELPVCPTINVDWHKTPPRKASISLAELAELYKRIAELGSVRRDWWRTALFTGLRRESLSTMRWADVDLEARTLHVPRPKGGAESAFTMPLSAVVVKILKQRKAENAQLAERSPWVFPAESESGHIEEPRADTLGVSPHDTRRLFITVAESTDASPYAIKLLVNHALPRDVTAGYMSLDVERLRPVMEAVAAQMLALCEPPPAAKVLPLKRRR